MVLDPIKREDILLAAKEIDQQGVPIGNRWAEYWIVINGKEYQFKHLTRIAYQRATGKKIEEDKFTSSPFTRRFIQRKFGYRIYFKVPDNVDFFFGPDLEFFGKTAGGLYSATKKKDIQAGQRIKSSIFNKTNVWARLIDMPDYEIIQDNRWQISGYFKQYSWARVYKSEYKASKVFFTLGVSSKYRSLVYKIDCQRNAYNKDQALSSDQIKEFDRIVDGTGAEWKEITLDELHTFNWEKLQRITLEFIIYYEALYSEASEAVINLSKDKSVSSFPLEEITIPKDAFDLMPEKTYTFNGVTIDYDANNRKFSEIGFAGEELVILLEQKRLQELGRNDLADKVEKVEDGRGYDILSFNSDGTTKYVEVKTTTGAMLRPFFMSDNEWVFMKKNAQNYCLYRVFNYDKILGIGKFFCLVGDIENKVFSRSRQIEIFIKSHHAK